MKKDDILTKGIWIHKNLGEVKITDQTLYMQIRNPDHTSVFVEKDDEIIEVSKSLINKKEIEKYGS